MDGRTRLRRAAAFLAPRRRAVGAVLVLALLIAALNACDPLVLKYIFDHVSGHGIAGALATGVAGMLALGVARELLNALQNWLTWKTRVEVQFSLTSATVGRLQHLPLSFHRNSGVGATMTKLDRGVQGFVTALNELAFNIVPSAAYLVLALVMMFRLSPRLGLLSLVFAPIPVIIARLASDEQLARERT